MNHYKKALPDPMPLHLKLVDGYGALVHNPLGAASGGTMIIPNLGLRMTPELVGLLGALPRFWDALVDVVMGCVSDNTRTRSDRRHWVPGKPYRHEHY